MEESGGRGGTLDYIYDRATFLERRDEELTTLDLRSLDLDIEGAVEAIRVSVKPHHRSIRLSSNFLGDDAWRVLNAECTANILSLDLADNYISQEGVQLLCPFLAKNRTLTHLNLSCNHIQRDGAATLISAIAGNPVLHTLDLSGNNIDKPRLQQLHETIRRNRQVAT